MPLRLVSVSLSDGLVEEMQEPLGIDASAFVQQLGRKLFLPVLIAGQGHQRSFLARNQLVAAHTIIFSDDPPAFLNVAAIIQGFVLISDRQSAFLAAHEKGGERTDLLLGQVQMGHAQFFFFGFDLALVPDIGFGELVFEETFVVVPRLLGRAFGEVREIVGIGDGLAAAAPARFR